MTITLDLELRQLNNLQFIIELIYDNLKGNSGEGFRETIDVLQKKVDDEIKLKRMEARKDADEDTEIPPFTGNIPLKVDKFRTKC